MIGLADDKLARCRVVCLFDERPDLAGRVAEAGEGAEILRVAECERRTVEGFSLPREGLSASRLRAVKVSLYMAAVALRLVS